MWVLSKRNKESASLLMNFDDRRVDNVCSYSSFLIFYFYCEDLRSHRCEYLDM